MNTTSKAYKAASIETAPPGKLILMLFDAALGSINKAERALKEPFSLKRQENIHNNLIKAQAIFTELQACLNFEASKEFAQTMFDLYAYMNAQLAQSNTKKTLEPLQNAKKVLEPIRDAWAEMLKTLQKQENVSLSSISCNA